MSHHRALGHITPQPTQYDPGLLEPIARALGRQKQNLPADCGVEGCDIWTAYEVSWLNRSGVPQIGVLEIRIDAGSPNIIESKSLKLYLGTFAQYLADSSETLRKIIREDLASVSGDAKLEVSWLVPQTVRGHDSWRPENALCIDQSPIENPTFDWDPTLLQLMTEGTTVEQTLYSDLLKSNCPVTHQPDWGSVLVTYRGTAIDPSALLRYILSYRNHVGFHELCVEQMYCDIMQYCQPEYLTVYARYTRRGGLDINPFRSNFQSAPKNIRMFRQ